MICQATEQQLQGIRQVNQSLEKLNQLTIENARYANVNAKSSSQLFQQADDLLEATRQLRMWEGDSNEFSSSELLATEKERQFLQTKK